MSIIEKGIPIPKRVGRKSTVPNVEKIAQLEVGDSILLTGASISSLQSAARHAAKCAGHRVTTRPEAKGLRVWRIENVAPAQEE